MFKKMTAVVAVIALIIAISSFFVFADDNPIINPSDNPIIDPGDNPVITGISGGNEETPESIYDSCPDISDPSAVYFYCLDSEKVLCEKRASDKVYPSSSAKMMTALIVSEFYNDFETKIKITDELLSGSGSSGTGYKVGMSVSIQDLFDSMVCSNANDATVILANSVAGSLSDFVILMNSKAKSLSMSDTVYANPTGADDSSSHTTLKDIAILAEKLLSNGKFTESSGSPSCYIESLKKRVYNRNYLRTTWYSKDYYNTSSTGMNAGFTSLSGYSVVASAQVDGNTYLAIIWGASGENGSFGTANKLIKWGSTGFGYKEVLSFARVFCELPVKYGNETDYAVVIPSRGSNVYLPSNVDTSKDIVIKWGVSEEILSAPIKEGTVVGKAEILYKDTVVDTVDLIIGNSIARNKSSYFMNIIKGFFKSRILWEIVSAIVIIALSVIVYRIYKKKGADFLTIKRKIKPKDDYDDENDYEDDPPTFEDEGTESENNDNENENE